MKIEREIQGALLIRTKIVIICFPGSIAVVRLSHSSSGETKWTLNQHVDLANQAGYWLVQCGVAGGVA